MSDESNAEPRPDANIQDGIKLDQSDRVLSRAEESLAVMNQVLTDTPANLASTAELALKVNDRATGFWEKLILLDGATIALSITFIGSLATRIPHMPRVSFLCLVCPAWCLLVTSVLCCWVQMGAIQYLAIADFEVTRAETQKIQLMRLRGMLQILSAEARQAVVEPITRADILEVMQRLTDAIAETGRQIESWETHASKERGKVTAAKLPRPFAKVALYGTATAFILLCAFAVRIILML
jgi:hypothetical protein